MLKGYKHSEETKKKMSDAHKGIKRPGIGGNKKGFRQSENAKRKISLALKGKRQYKMTDEIREKLSKAHKGKHHSPKTEFKKGCLSQRKGGRYLQIAGEKHYCWKGGISSLMERIRKCLKYRQWRSDIFERDNWTCQDCNARNGKGESIYLEAHHIESFSKIVEKNKIKNLENALNCEELWNINNGQTLCWDCHNKTKKWKIN